METKNSTPEIGMGVAYYAGSDIYSFTVVEVSNKGRILVVQMDSAKRTDNNGWGGNQVWDIQPNPNGVKRTITLRKDGNYHAQGEGLRSFKTSLIL